MTGVTTIEVDAVTKRFGDITAVNALSFRVEPGRVTGFLGPNGAGKTTTLRILLGLVRASEGRATFGGTPYAQLTAPLRTVGAALEAASFHPGRSARNHLRIAATAAGIPRARVDEVLEIAGLTGYADRRVSGYSLGMRQRLGLASALLGDPGVLVFDEPINGLDPEGIKWIRSLLRALAGEGRTVLVSSHLLSEVQQSVDDVVIVARGELVHSGTLASLSSGDSVSVLVDAPDREGLARALAAAGYAVTPARSGFVVADAEAEEVGRVAFAAGIALSALSRRSSGLEDTFLHLVEGNR